MGAHARNKLVRLEMEFQSKNFEHYIERRIEKLQAILQSIIRLGFAILARSLAKCVMQIISTVQF